MTTAQTEATTAQRLFLDSCASTGLLIVRNANTLDQMDTAPGTINLTKKGAFMSTQGIGTKGSWQEITVCADSVKNIIIIIIMIIKIWIIRWLRQLTSSSTEGI